MYGIESVICVVCAFLIQFIEYPYQRVAGNMCDNPPYGYCYELGWKLGIPFDWVNGSSVSASNGSGCGFVFFSDVVICALGLFVLYKGIRCIAKKVQRLSRSIVRHHRL